MAKKPDAVTPFRDKIWDLFQEQAVGMDGADVVSALKQAGEEIWAVGIDKAYTDMKHQDDEPLGNPLGNIRYSYAAGTRIEIETG